jgi:hypothetical protein
MNQKEIFDNILNESLDRLYQGESLAVILADHPEQSRVLEPLLKVAAAGRSFANIKPRIEFKERARSQFMAEVQDLEHKHHSPSFWRWLKQPAWAVGLAALLIVVISGGGTVLASQNSLPGQALYSVKLASETVRLSLTFSDVAKTQLNAEFANRRTEEISSLATSGSIEQIQMATARLNTNLSNMSSLTRAENPVAHVETTVKEPPGVLLSKNTGGSQNSAQAAVASQDANSNLQRSGTPVPATGADNTNTMSAPAVKSAPMPALAPIAPAPGPVPPSAAMGNGMDNTALTQDNHASQETVVSAYNINNNSTTGKTLTKQEKMRKIIEDNYFSRKANLEAALNKAPPDLRPAIRQAIADSEDEYIKELLNLDQAVNQVGPSKNASNSNQR